MKKLLLSMLLGMMALGATAQSMYGDVNGDGEVNITDVNHIINIILAGDYDSNSDVNSDGEVNITDLNVIIELILNPTIEPPVEEHEWVDLGLPSGTLWATCNVGANSPEEFGDYFAWGETVPKDYYHLGTYKWCNGSYNTMTKYCIHSNFGADGLTDGKTELDPDDDAAYVNWGPQWRMPTLEQLQELIDKCTWTWTTKNGVNGRLVTGPNGNTMFLPAASYRVNDSYAGSGGFYWSRMLDQSNSYRVHKLGFDNYYKSRGYGYRDNGLSVRAVRVEKLYIEQKSLDLGVLPVETTRTSEMTIVNNDPEAQTLTVSVDEPFFLKQEQGSTSSMTIEVPAKSRATVTVMFTATELGEFNGNVTFLSPELDGDQCVIPVHALVVPQCDYVDLGLPSGTLWATCNIGASSPEEYGDYFAWGETEPKDYYDWSTYKWCNGSMDSMTKYCTDDNKTELDPEDDAAYVNWGSSWRMPTSEQQQELTLNCTWTWAQHNGVAGQLVTGPNGNTIFLPTAGYRGNQNLHQAGLDGYYWSRTLSPNALLCGWSGPFWNSNLLRYMGCSVRAVRVS